MEDTCRVGPARSVSEVDASDAQRGCVYDEITVAGQASDSSAISGILVNGAPATSSDGFLNWSAVVPLVAGINELVVETQDVLGHRDTSAASAVVDLRYPEKSLNEPSYVAYDAARDRALVVVGITSRSVITVDLDSGSTAPFVELSEDVWGITGIAVDAIADRALLLSGGGGGYVLYAADLETGNLTVLTDNTTGTGPAIERVNALAVDSDGQRAIIAHEPYDQHWAALTEVDLATGNRTRIADSTHGSGPDPGLNFGYLGGLAVDFAGDEAYVGSYEVGSGNSIMSVDLTTGDRSTLLSSSYQPRQFVFDGPRQIRQLDDPLLRDRSRQSEAHHIARHAIPFEELREDFGGAAEIGTRVGLLGAQIKPLRSAVDDGEPRVGATDISCEDFHGVASRVRIKRMIGCTPRFIEAWPATG